MVCWAPKLQYGDCWPPIEAIDTAKKQSQVNARIFDRSRVHTASVMATGPGVEAGESFYTYALVNFNDAVTT